MFRNDWEEPAIFRNCEWPFPRNCLEKMWFMAMVLMPDRSKKEARFIGLIAFHVRKSLAARNAITTPVTRSDMKKSLKLE